MPLRVATGLALSAHRTIIVCQLYRLLHKDFLGIDKLSITALDSDKGTHRPATEAHERRGTMRSPVEKQKRPGCISVSVRRITCDPSEGEGCEHPSLSAYVAAIHHNHVVTGQIKLYRLSVVDMKPAGTGEMWRQCQSYDSMHFGGKLNKIENFLANESFFAEAAVAIGEADEILYIEEVVLDKNSRGQGLGLQALYQAVAHLELPEKSVLMLEPGGVGQLECSHEEAGEKLAKHWSQLGFRVWSYTDEAWMCVNIQDFALPVVSVFPGVGQDM